MAEKINKKGQVAIWVIIAVIGIALVMVFLLLKKPRIGDITNEDYNPKSFIEQCIRKVVADAGERMLSQGGFLIPENNLSYNNLSVPYLCKNTGNFFPCVNQHPAYIEEMTDILKKDTEPKVENCFAELKNVLERRNILMDSDKLSYSIEFIPGRINVNVQKNVTLSGNIKENLDNFDTKVSSPLYNLGIVATEIVNNEARYCYFEYNGYMLLHPELVIEKTALSDGTKIYTLKDLESGKNLLFAVRGCVLPEGI